MSKWQSMKVCANCKTRLSSDEEMYSDGVCPYCGTISGDTIVDTETVVYRKKKRKHWWNIFEKPAYEAKLPDLTKPVCTPTTTE